MNWTRGNNYNKTGLKPSVGGKGLQAQGRVIDGPSLNTSPCSTVGFHRRTPCYTALAHLRLRVKSYRGGKCTGRGNCGWNTVYKRSLFIILYSKSINSSESKLFIWASKTECVFSMIKFIIQSVSFTIIEVWATSLNHYFPTWNLNTNVIF